MSNFLDAIDEAPINRVVLINDDGAAGELTLAAGPIDPSSSILENLTEPAVFFSTIPGSPRIYLKMGGGTLDYVLPESSNGGGATGDVPFFRADGIQDNIAVTVSGLPFFRANGVQDDIALV